MMRLPGEYQRRLAEAGYARTRNDVGMMFGRGLGVAQSHRDAAVWTQRAAEQGFPEALRNPGSMYEHGSGLPGVCRRTNLPVPASLPGKCTSAMPRPPGKHRNSGISRTMSPQKTSD